MMQAVLRAFEAQIIVKGLKRLYVTLNDLFIKNDVLPVIIYQAVKSESSESVNASPQTSEAEQPHSPDAGPGSASTPIMAPGIQASEQHPAKPVQISGAQTLSAVQNLLSLQQTSGTMTTASNEESLPPIATEQLLSQLTQLQNRSLDTFGSEETGIEQPFASSPGKMSRCGANTQRTR